MCKHARIYIGDGESDNRNERKRETMWLADILIIIVRLRVSPRFTVAAALPFSFFFFFFFVWFPILLNYLCDALRTFNGMGPHHWILLFFFLCYCHFVDSFQLQCINFSIQCSIQVRCFVHLQQIYIKFTYIINFGRHFFFLGPLQLLNRRGKKNSNVFLESVTVFLYFGISLRL